MIGQFTMRVQLGIHSKSLKDTLIQIPLKLIGNISQSLKNNFNSFYHRGWGSKPTTSRIYQEIDSSQKFFINN